MRTALTIAGSDTCAGAGIQADIKTMAANGVYATCAVTALTAQDTAGVNAIMEVSPEFMGQQLDSIFNDIFPEAVKTGMLASCEIIEVIADRLERYNAKNIVIDPVMISTGGTDLIGRDAVECLKARLLPLADIVTPNIPEAQALTGIEIRSAQDMEKAAAEISKKFGCSVLLKGGHSAGDADDLFFGENGMRWFGAKRIDNPNTHGTGCTLSSAIAANLAKGYCAEEAVGRAKDYISGAIGAMLDLGKGSGPLDHIFDMKSKFKN